MIGQAPECHNNISQDPFTARTDDDYPIPRGVVPGLVAEMQARGAQAECWYDHWESPIMLWLRPDGDQLAWILHSRWECVNHSITGAVSTRGQPPDAIIAQILAGLDEAAPGWPAFTISDEAARRTLRFSPAADPDKLRCAMDKNNLSPDAVVSPDGGSAELAVPVVEGLPRLSAAEAADCMARQTQYISKPKWCRFDYEGTVTFSQ